MFQSTYLYKVRRLKAISELLFAGFNPRTYIRYDSMDSGRQNQRGRFNPRTYIRYDDGEGINVDFTHVSIHVPI